MVLEWIDPKNRHLYVNEKWREYSNETARDVAPFAYADDLATWAAGPQAEYMQQFQLQLQAKWLSAFCAFSAPTIHPCKTKATIVGKCTADTIPGQNQTERNIDPTLATYKYLSVHLHLRCKNTLILLTGKIKIKSRSTTGHNRLHPI
jgi:hypothetical protein